MTTTKTSESPLVVTKPDGTQIDHIGLACRDLEEGVAYVRERTGLAPRVNPPVAGLPFQNAYVRIGEASFLEILGPNPKHGGIHPLKSLLRRFSRPALWFWYVSTNDFDALEAAVAEAGRCVERKTEAEAAAETGPGYVGASIGPGFFPVYPNAIEWKADIREALLKDLPIVPLEDFSVEVGDPMATATSFFQAIGIDGTYLKESDDGRNYLSLTLRTPEKGSVTFRSEAESLSTWTVLKTLLRDLMGCL